MQAAIKSNQLKGRLEDPLKCFNVSFFSGALQKPAGILLKRSLSRAICGF
jgi:hypothetical protein